MNWTILVEIDERKRVNTFIKKKYILSLFIFGLKFYEKRKKKPET